MASAVVVDAFDPGDDLDAEVVAGLPATPPVEHVLLEQGEERFHGRVIAGGADLAHRADRLSPDQRPRPNIGHTRPTLVSHPPEGRSDRSRDPSLSSGPGVSSRTPPTGARPWGMGPSIGAEDPLTQHPSVRTPGEYRPWPGLSLHWTRWPRREEASRSINPTFWVRTRRRKQPLPE